LINNAVYPSEPSALVDLSHLYARVTQAAYGADSACSENNLETLDQELLESFRVNVIGVANTIAAFLPLIKQGNAKKVITLSSGMADLGTFSCHSSLRRVENTYLSS
jgi:NAD(P)-dependent dehydrogenase (short-subunit alcohol dehydrogenase family)